LPSEVLRKTIGRVARRALILIPDLQSEAHPVTESAMIGEPKREAHRSVSIMLYLK